MDDAVGGKIGERERPTLNVQRPTSNRLKFEEALDDDLNISGALGVLFETIRETNRALDGGAGCDRGKSWLRVVGTDRSRAAITGNRAPFRPEITALADARVQARLAKDWRKSDELRDELNARGWEARDTKDGQEVTRRAGA